METSSVVQAVKQALEGRFQEPVYLDRVPKEFARPSFAVELQKSEWTDLNQGLVRKTVTLLVTGFVEVDAYHDSSREKLNRRQEQVMTLFAGPGMQVEDRWPAVSANKGVGSPDFFEVQVTFSWSDAKPGVPDRESGSVPKMEYISVNDHVFSGGASAGTEKLRGDMYGDNQ